MSSVTGNLCNKCPKQLVKQNSSYSDDFNAISGFTSNSRAPGGPVTLKVIVNAIIFRKFLIISGLLHAVTIKILTAVKPLLVKNKNKSFTESIFRKKERKKYSLWVCKIAIYESASVLLLLKIILIN